MITASSIDALWFQALAEVTTFGRPCSPRGAPVREIRGVKLRLTDPAANVLRHPDRKLNYYFMVAEWLWMLGGRRDVETIAAYNKQIAQFSDDGKVFFGAYGPKITAQLRQVIALLQRDPDTRQAIIDIWRPEALTTKTADVPCTLNWQFFVRDGALELQVNMRSNDIWLGFPYDVFNFTQMQRYVAAALGIGVGHYEHHVGSLHLYAMHDEAAQRVLTAGPRSSATLAAPTYPVPEDVDAILAGLANKRLPVDVARAMSGLLPPGWQPYTQLLIHRFTKDAADLGTEVAGLVSRG